MASVWLYTIASVLIVSIISFVGIITLSIKLDKLKKFLIYMISFAAGALLGDVFIHLLPEIIKEGIFSLQTSFFILGGIVLFFIMEKVIHWQHCHMPQTSEHTHPFAKLNLIGDGLHNFIDGIIIGASYLVNIPLGIATSLAVILHEIPQEIGDFGVLIHGGYSKSKALAFNFLSAFMAVIGAVIALVSSNYIDNLISYLIPITIGAFIYIAGSDLIPELHKDFKTGKSFLQLLFLILGILVMAALLLLE